MDMRLRHALAAALLIFIAACWPTGAIAQTTIRIAWYSDGNEGEVLLDLLKRFESANPDIKVAVDQMPFKAISETIPVQLASGQGPDIVRITDFGGIARYMLDLRPYLTDAAYWERNFGPFMQWMRVEGDTTSIPGFMTQLTITGPFVNKTLFEQAAIPLPGPKATWDDWAKAAKAVAEKTQVPFPIAFDRSGHRVFGPVISEGGKIFNDKGEPAVVDDGFKAMAQRFYDWHKSGVMSKELWGSVSGATYRGANDEFKNAQVVMYMSGSWQIAQFAATIGDAFDWVAVPNPCGPAACTGMPGGAALVGLTTSQHPEEVGKLMDFLTREDVLNEFYGRTLFVPGHIGLSRSGVDFQTDSALAKEALAVFAGQVDKISPVAYALQGYPLNRILFGAVISRLGQAIAGEMTLDEAYQRITEDIDTQIAEREREE
jgi:alpha-1,4-digalacturonate transport system substrate-binding protein